MTDLHYAYRLGISTISNCVRDVCWSIWEVLHEEVFPMCDEPEWQNIAIRFMENANFPNCLGAIDGKHIRIIKPTASGSLYYNYKNFYSMVLLAVCGAQYNFTYVDIGSFGKVMQVYSRILHYIKVLLMRN